MTQDEAFSILTTGANVFLTGEPGSGKTHTVNRFTAWLKEHSITPAITASTGIAATHIHGQTIHSWSGIGVRSELTKADLTRIASNKRVVSRVRETHTLIIDEISMLSAHTLTMVETVCRVIRGNPAPFGGMQVVLVGDFFQLPPIATREENKPGENALLEFGAQGGESIFAFNSPAWEALDLNICHLSEQHRQDDPTFLHLLSAIRSGSVSAQHRALLQSKYVAHATDGATQFFAHNADVDRINTAKLNALPGNEHAFAMKRTGAEQLAERLARGCLSPETLNLKVGARVMFTKNDSFRHRFANGTLGTVTEFSKNDGYPIVTTNAGKTVIAEPADWNIEEHGKILARITQIPLRLAWAITIHKSQGMSLDAAHMDLSDAFEHGQGYVAISRVRTLDGLSLAGFNERALEVHPEIAKKDKEFREASRNAQKSILSTSSANLHAQQAAFIRACGGTMEPRKDEAENDVVAILSGTKKISPREQTAALMRKRLTIEEAATYQHKKAATIIDHIEELLLLKKVSQTEIAHLAKGNERVIEEILNAFRALGSERLKPVHEYFKGRYSYELLRLAKLFFEART